MTMTHSNIVRPGIFQHRALTRTFPLSSNHLHLAASLLHLSLQNRKYNRDHAHPVCARCVPRLVPRNRNDPMSKFKASVAGYNCRFKKKKKKSSRPGKAGRRGFHLVTAEPLAVNCLSITVWRHSRVFLSFRWEARHTSG